MQWLIPSMRRARKAQRIWMKCGFLYRHIHQLMALYSTVQGACAGDCADCLQWVEWILINAPNFQFSSPRWQKQLLWFLAVAADRGNWTIKPLGISTLFYNFLTLQRKLCFPGENLEASNSCQTRVLSDVGLTHGDYVKLRTLLRV